MTEPLFWDDGVSWDDGGPWDPASTPSNAAGTGRVHELFRGLNDDGVAIESFWLTSWVGIQQEEPLERVRRINLEHEGNIEVTVYEDLDLATPDFADSVSSPNNQLEAWDDGEVWDDGLTWDVQPKRALSRVRPESRGRYHAIKVSNNEMSSTFQLFAMELAIRGGKEITE